MIVGRIYTHQERYQWSNIVALTEPDLDGNMVILKYKAQTSAIIGGSTEQSVLVDKNSSEKVKTAAQVFDILLKSGLTFVYTSEAEMKKTGYIYDSYSYDMAIGMGDKYLYVDKGTEYMVWGIVYAYKRYDPNSQTTGKQPFIFGVNTDMLVNYTIGKVASKKGVESIYSNGNFDKKYKSEIESLIQNNCDLTWWSLNDRKPSGIVYMKQAMPEYRYEVNTTTRDLSMFTAILGAQYEEEFLRMVAGLDWIKIGKAKNRNPEVVQALRNVIDDMYAEYLLEKDKSGAFDNPKLNSWLENVVYQETASSNITTELRKAYDYNVSDADIRIFNFSAKKSGNKYAIVYLYCDSVSASEDYQQWVGKYRLNSSEISEVEGFPDDWLYDFAQTPEVIKNGLAKISETNVFALHDGNKHLQEYWHYLQGRNIATPPEPPKPPTPPTGENVVLKGEETYEPTSAVSQEIVYPFGEQAREFAALEIVEQKYHCTNSDTDVVLYVYYFAMNDSALLPNLKKYIDDFLESLYAKSQLDRYDKMLDTFSTLMDKVIDTDSELLTKGYTATINKILPFNSKQQFFENLAEYLEENVVVQEPALPEPPKKKQTRKKKSASDDENDQKIAEIADKYKNIDIDF